VKFIYRILLIFTIIVFVFLVFFVEECIRLELNLYDKPLVKLKVEEIKSNNKNIYIEEIHSLGFTVRYEYDLNQKSEDLVQYTISKKTFKTMFKGNVWQWSKDTKEEDIKKIITENNYTIIDVRTKEEFDSGHLVDAINIPKEELEKNLNKLDKNKYIFVYCRSGRRSHNAMIKLNKNGFKNVVDLGGYEKITFFKKINKLEEKNENWKKRNN